MDDKNLTVCTLGRSGPPRAWVSCDSHFVSTHVTYALDSSLLSPAPRGQLSAPPQSFSPRVASSFKFCHSIIKVHLRLGLDYCGRASSKIAASMRLVCAHTPPRFSQANRGYDEAPQHACCGVASIFPAKYVREGGRSRSVGFLHS